MDKFCSFIVKKRNWLTIIFILLIAACSACIYFVKINYNDTDYLPEDSNFSIGLEIMNKQFGDYGNATIMYKDCNISDSFAIKEKISAIKGVRDIVYIDNFLEIVLEQPISHLMQEEQMDVTPMELSIVLTKAVLLLPENFENISNLELIGIILVNFNEKEVQLLTYLFNYFENNPNSGFGNIGEFKEQFNQFYSDNCAIYRVSFEKGDYAKSTMAALKDIENLDKNIYFTGNSVMAYLGQKTLIKQVLISSILVVAAALIIMFLFSSSFFEPLLYIVSVGVAIIINMGSNIIFSKGISYITNSVASVLQLALSIDYSIFLLQRFKKERAEGKDVQKSMADALKSSFSPISASSLTTIASFIALMFMKYKIGLDMGLVMGKGILISLLTTFLFLPGLIVYSHKAIEKTEHKTFNLSCRRLAGFLYKFRIVIVVLALVIIAPSIYFESQNTFLYGSESAQGGAGSEYNTNTEIIEDIFGKQNQIAILIPYSYGKDKEISLAEKLSELQDDGISSIQSLSIMENSGYADYLNEKLKKQFAGKSYSRMILTLSCSEESEQTENLLKKIKDIAESELSGENEPYFILGASPATYEIKELTQLDFKIISIIAMFLVMLVLFFTYKSVILPLLLVICIQSSIWLNMTIPYLFGTPVVFIGYMIICNVLLGSTIDYAILMTTHYLENRKLLNKKEAMQKAMEESSRALILSAGIFTLGGFIIGLSMNMPTTRMFGFAIMRGGICAFFMVFLILPSLLVIFDKLIQKLTFKSIKESILKKKKKQV